HAHLGIPTLTPSNPQLIFVDPNAYHPNQHKQFLQLKPHQLTPYPTLTKFTPHTTYQTKHKTSQPLFHQLKEKI
ncbi:acetolactate decarboxylase, partial [Staphylococcus warneri]|uniref:acetolactate decarboxylase n=1 Tax=Staphylococcus warneri TaxID=1292 RepID=UPI001642735C